MSILFLVGVSTLLFAQKMPTVNKTELSKEAFNQKISSLEGKKILISEVVKKYEGRILIIDFWASWC